MSPNRKTSAATRPKVLDVAKAAGVSVASVSRAFNGLDGVSTKVRDHIFQVAKAMSYSPNAAAKALRSRRSHIVGVVIPTLDYAIYAKMVHAVQEKLYSDGYTALVLASGFDNRSVADRVRLLVERGAEGLILVGKVDEDSVFQATSNPAFPVISTYSAHDSRRIPSVGFDNYQAIAKVMRYLIANGHTEIAMIVGPTRGNDRQRDRKKAFLDAMRRLGRRKPVLIETPYSMAAGAASFKEIVLAAPNTTAIICSSDVLAFGVLVQAKADHIAVPEQMSVVGFDDMEFAALLDPPLTTVAIPAELMGRLAAEAFLDMLRTKKSPASIKLDTELTIRRSTAAAPL